MGNTGDIKTVIHYYIYTLCFGIEIVGKELYRIKIIRFTVTLT